MTAQSVAAETVTANSVQPALDDALANEIRIVQSVQVQTNMPVIVAGNGAIIGIVFAIDWRAAVDTYAAWVLVLELLIFVPMMRSWWQLRNKPRPAQVSRRRIQGLEISSLIMGLIWAVAILLFMSALSPIDGVLWLWNGYILCFTGAFLISSTIRGAAAFATPVALANLVGAFVYETLPAWILIILCAAGITSLSRMIWLNWRQTEGMVRLSVENIEAEAERARMLETVSSQLGKYMSPQLYQSIFRGEEKVEIASRRKKLTVFFSDIAGFTEITDQLESEELTALLNRYLTEMSAIALDHGATLDKFIGDAIVVYFGDPESQGVREDAAACVRMAIAMQARMAALKDEWLDMGVERPFELRIGINTGYCTVGNFGSDARMDHTIIGGEVNLAARLEAAADVGGILLANETFSLVKDWVDAEEAESITVKGFARPVRTYRVKGSRDGLATGDRVLQHDHRALTAMLENARVDPAAKASAIETLEKALAELKA